ncbi:MAG: hypothetical protein HXX11_16310 [Desulfuromonadales bacterium]|nr:hypothetical protein [Desulfuromonadales bacterium]
MSEKNFDRNNSNNSKLVCKIAGTRLAPQGSNRVTAHNHRPESKCRPINVWLEEVQS